MSSFSSNCFTVTSAEDLSNYFFGENQLDALPPFSVGNNPLKPGTYRVMDGELCQVISGLQQEEVRTLLLQASETAE